MPLCLLITSRGHYSRHASRIKDDFFTKYLSSVRKIDAFELQVMKGRALFSQLPTMSVMILCFQGNGSLSLILKFSMYLRTNLQYWASETVGLKSTSIPLVLLVEGGKIKSRLSVLRNFLLQYLFGFCVTTNYQNKIYLTQVSVSPFKEAKI